MPGEFGEWAIDFGDGHKLVFSAKDEEAAIALNKGLKAVQAQAEGVEGIAGSLHHLQGVIEGLDDNFGDRINVQKVFKPSPFLASYPAPKKKLPAHEDLSQQLDKLWGLLGNSRPEATDPQTRAWNRTQGREKLVMYPRKAQEGYRDETIDIGWLGYHNIRDLLARFFLTVHANRGRIGNWRPYCIGITSMVGDHKPGLGGSYRHMPMFDYDGKNIKTRVKKDVKKLQKKYNLGDATIFSTRSGLHVYFFSDLVTGDTFMSMLEEVACCKGFKEAAQRKGYAVLRISAKYTEFDIQPYKTVVSPHRVTSRPGKKAALIKALIQLGQECGTHFASLYPQWAYFKEDPTPWKPQKRRSGKRIRKVSMEEYNEMVASKKKATLKQAYFAKKKSNPAFYTVNWGWDNGSSNTASTSVNEWYVSTFNK